MLVNISNLLQRECKLHSDDLLLVGVSGGPDSLCLLHVMHQLGYSIIAVHVNHKLRPEADEEAHVVEQFSRGLEVDFMSLQLDVLAYSRENSISIEEAARNLRYSSLFEQAKTLKASAVLVGHNADDQVETILMHLLRGSGLAGLRGIEYRTVPNPWSEEIPLVRPLLSTWRTDIQKYIDENNLHPITDRSNLDTTFFRNRLRHELLPFLEEYNPCIRQVLFRMGQSLKDDYSVLQQLADNAWKATLVQQGEGFLAFRKADYLKLPLSIQRYLLRKAIAYHLPGLRDVGFDCIERGLTFLAGDKLNSQTDLTAGVRLIKELDQFWLATWQADLPGSNFPFVTPGEKLILTIPSALVLDNGWRLQVEKITDLESANLQSHTNSDPFQAWLDIGELDQPLSLRSRKRGDHIKPLGLNGHSMKISDLMINLKLPNRARAGWPLICSGEEILWVPGFRLSDLVRITSESKQIIHLTLSQS